MPCMGPSKEYAQRRAQLLAEAYTEFLKDHPRPGILVQSLDRPGRKVFAKLLGVDESSGAAGREAREAALLAYGFLHDRESFAKQELEDYLTEALFDVDCGDF